MRILFIVLMALPHAGAAWTRIESFANYMKEMNHNVVIAGAFSPRTLRQAGSTKWNGITIYNVIPTIFTTNLFLQVLDILSALVVCIFLFLIIKPKVVVISVPPGRNALGCYIIS